MKACTCIALFLYILCGQVTSQDVETVCPLGAWTVDTDITITCNVSKTKFPSQCVTNFQNEVRFRKGKDAKNFDPNCTVSSATPCAGTSVSPGTCGCVSESSTQYVYQYTFKAKTDYAGYWDCNIPCNNGLIPQLTSERGSGCDNVQVMEKIYQPPDKSSQVRLSLGLGLGLGLSLVLVVVSVAWVVVAWKKRALQRENEEDLRTLERKQTLLTEQMSRCPTCKNFNPAAANSGHEPTPDYENAAKKTGHKATGRPHNGVADEHV